MSNDSPSTSRPMYEQIFASLRERIEKKQYTVGDRVPSEKELCEEFGVSRITSKKALEMLATDGYIVRQPGRGSFVSVPQPAAAAVPVSASAARGGMLLIGLIITTFSDSYGTGLVHAMEEASRANGCFLVLRRTLGKPEHEEEAIRQLLELGVDGLIIFPAQGEFFSAEILKLVISQFPLVMVDRYLKGINAASVCTDNLEAAKDAARHLFGLGHKHIALLTQPPVNTTTIEDRIEGFIQAHAEQGIIVDRELWLESITSTLPSVPDEECRSRDIQAIMEHLRRNPHITAVFAIEYEVAELTHIAAQQLGLSVPEQLSIICFDSPDSSDLSRYTHMRQNQNEMGRLAFEHVLQLQKGEASNQRTTLQAALVQGASTGAARQTAQ